MMQQTITPNPNIPCMPGYCLMYVRQTFGLPARYGSATEAWNNSPSQHQDRDFPSGVWIPVWYGIDREPLGHVVLMAPDGSVYSTSDNSTVPHHHPSLADLEDFYAGWGWPLTYRGWTEDVAGFTVITPTGLLSYAGESITPLEQEDDLMATPEQRQDLIRELLDTTVDESRPGKQITLRQMLSEYRDHVVQTQEKINSVPESVLNARVPRGGQMGGETSLGAVISWSDQHVIDGIAATAAVAASDGATVEDIKAAVKSAIAESVVKVDVTVEGVS